MTPGTFNLKALIDFGMRALISQVGLAGEVSQHVPDLVNAGMKHFDLPDNVEMPLPIEVLGKVMISNIRRQQQIDEAWRQRNANPESS